MSVSMEVAIGVVQGKVIAKWPQAVDAIEFDPQNAYRIGLMLSRAAMEAYRGNEAKDADMELLIGELAQVGVKVSDAKRDMLIAAVSTILKTLIDQKRSPGYIALHCVDQVLKETAR